MVIMYQLKNQTKIINLERATLTQLLYINTPQTHPLGLVSNETYHPNGGHPTLELSDPVVQGRLGGDNEMGRRNVAVVFHVAKQRYRLQRLAETLKKKW